MTLAFYLGKAAAADPPGYFHIVSKDKGFDPMIEHLKSQRIKIRRHDAFSVEMFSAIPKPTAKPEDLFTRAVKHLKTNKTNRPKRKKTLIAHLTTFAGGKGHEEAALEIISKLQKAGHLTIGEKEAVAYKL